MRKALLLSTSSQFNESIHNVSHFLKTSRNYNHITIITDITSQKPIKAVIMALIKQLLVENQSGDELWFHYIGNGDLINDIAIWPIDFEKNGFITDDELRRELIDKVKYGVNLYVVLDSFHSGTGFDLRYIYNDSSKYVGSHSQLTKYNFNEWQLVQSLYENKKYMKTTGNVFMISAYKDSAEKKENMAGGITYSLLKVLKSNYGNMKWKHLLKDIRCLLKIKGASQIPQLSVGRSIYIDRQIFQNSNLVFC